MVLIWIRIRTAVQLAEIKRATFLENPALTIKEENDKLVSLTGKLDKLLNTQEEILSFRAKIQENEQTLLSLERSWNRLKGLNLSLELITKISEVAEAGKRRTEELITIRKQLEKEIERLTSSLLEGDEEERVIKVERLKELQSLLEKIEQTKKRLNFLTGEKKRLTLLLNEANNQDKELTIRLDEQTSYHREVASSERVDLEKLADLRGEKEKNLLLQRELNSSQLHLNKLAVRKTETESRHEKLVKKVKHLEEKQGNSLNEEKRHLALWLSQDLKAGERCPVCSQEILPSFTVPGKMGYTKKVIFTQEQKLLQEAARLEGENTEVNLQIAALRVTIENQKNEMQEGIEKTYEEYVARLVEISQKREEFENKVIETTKEKDEISKALNELKEQYSFVNSEYGQLKEVLNNQLARKLAINGAFGLSNLIKPDRILILIKGEETKIAVERQKIIGIRDLEKRLSTTILTGEEERRRNEKELAEIFMGANESLVILRDCLQLEDVESEHLNLTNFTDRIKKAIREKETAITNYSNQKDVLGNEMAVLYEKELTRLQDNGINSFSKLEEELNEERINKRMCEQRLVKAKEDLPKVLALELAMTPAKKRSIALQEVYSLLTDNRFVGYVVRKKEVALLREASSILLEMSGGRLGFSTGFTIVERGAGLARDPRTLSGGETFMASLALSLGLVEMAGREGGRLGAVFLDEGFGSLDAQALDDALDALEKETQSGRLVGVVSHLRGVAERIERVLLVNRDEDYSSIATWVTNTEKEAMLQEEIETNLLV